jgi:signal transduction histidine kinase
MAHAGERELWLDLKDESRAVLSAAPAERGHRRAAFWTVAISALVFAAAIPFAKVQLPAFPAFIASYQSALVVSDLVTAALLFSQFAFLGSRPLLALATAYVFTAFMAVAHALTFPGLLAPTGLLGATPQTTAWMYMFWHAGFPALAIVYALLERNTEAAPRRPWATAGACIAAAAAATIALTALATSELLPPIMRGHNYTPAMQLVVGSVWAMSALAIAILWRRRTHTVLELWLMVVLVAWIFDIGLAAVFNHGRYDFGFYAGRVYGLLAACFVLVVLLYENGLLYRRLLAAYAGERAERRRVQEVSAALAAANRELDAFSYSVSHDLRAPLRAVDGYGHMLEEDYGARLDDEGRRLLRVLREGSRRMERMISGMLQFSRLGRKAPEKARVDMSELVRSTLTSLGEEARRAEVQVGELPAADADPGLMQHVWLNLLGNALKYSGKRAEPRIEVGARAEPGRTVYWVRDNGAGFDMRYAGKLFGAFQRLHKEEEFPGIGVGLATVRRIVERHGGRVWAEGEPDAGATFYFTLPAA